MNLDSDFAHGAVKVQIPRLPEVFIVLDGLHVVLSDSLCVCVFALARQVGPMLITLMCSLCGVCVCAVCVFALAGAASTPS